MKIKVYCPKCRSKKPMVKAGIAYSANGEKQRWLCCNWRCHRITVNPLRRK